MWAPSPSPPLSPQRTEGNPPPSSHVLSRPFLFVPSPKQAVRETGGGAVFRRRAVTRGRYRHVAKLSPLRSWLCGSCSDDGAQGQLFKRSDRRMDLDLLQRFDNCKGSFLERRVGLYDPVQPIGSSRQHSRVNIEQNRCRHSSAGLSLHPFLIAVFFAQLSPPGAIDWTKDHIPEKPLS